MFLIDSHAQLFLLWWPVDSPIPGDSRAPFLVQHHVGRDQERGGAVQLFHRGAADLAPLLAVSGHQFLHVLDDDRSLDGPRTSRMAGARLRLGGHLPACDRGWEPRPLPGRTQPMVDDLLVLIHSRTIRRCLGSLSC